MVFLSTRRHWTEGLNLVVKPFFCGFLFCFRSPLQLAARLNRVQCARELLESGARLDFQDSRGYSAVEVHDCTTLCCALPCSEATILFAVVTYSLSRWLPNTAQQK